MNYSTIAAYPHWEMSVIGFTIKDQEGNLHFFDITRGDAIILANEINKAVKTYDTLEEDVKEQK